MKVIAMLVAPKRCRGTAAGDVPPMLAVGAKRCMALAVAAAAFAPSVRSGFAQEREGGDDVDEPDPSENKIYGAPDLPEITRDERARAIRELKRV